MGEAADMMLDGTCCSSCGEYLGGDEGFPVQCAACADDEPAPKPKKEKVRCPQCNKRVKKVGLDDHIRDVHPSKACEFLFCKSGEPGTINVSETIGDASYYTNICQSCADIIGLKSGDIIPDDGASVNTRLQRAYADKESDGEG